jgi:hypothetical protein
VSPVRACGFCLGFLRGKLCCCCCRPLQEGEQPGVLRSSFKRASGSFVVSVCVCVCVCSNVSVCLPSQ